MFSIPKRTVCSGHSRSLVFDIPGWLRDVTGDYVASFLAAGSFILAGSLVLITLPNFSTCLALPVLQRPDPKPEVSAGAPLASAPVLSPHDVHPYEVVPEAEKPLSNG